jgi:hypothetical protein
MARAPIQRQDSCEWAILWRRGSLQRRSLPVVMCGKERILATRILFLVYRLPDRYFSGVSTSFVSYRRWRCGTARARYGGTVPHRKHRFLVLAVRGMERSKIVHTVPCGTVPYRAVRTAGSAVPLPLSNAHPWLHGKFETCWAWRYHPISRHSTRKTNKTSDNVST